MFAKELILVFDLDNTLVLRDEAMLNCVENIFEMQLSVFQTKEIERQDERGHSDRQLFCKWLKNFLQLPLKTAVVWELIRQNIGYFTTLNKDAEAVLKMLKRQHKLVLLTNGGIENQERKIAQTGLNEFFTFENIFISEALDCEKPDPQIFQIVANHFNKSAQFYMIGDHWEKDILGAVNVGWNAVYLNKKSTPTTMKNVKIIATLAELIPLLNGFNEPD